MSVVIPLLTTLALLVAGAHFWRAGLWGLAFSCLALAALAWTRKAWARLVLCFALVTVAARWIWITDLYVRMRMLMGEPWQRLAVILLGVAAFTALAAALLRTRRAAARYNRRPETAFVQAFSFLPVAGVLAALSWNAPSLLLADRLLPGAGFLQALGLGLWAAWVAGALADRRGAPAARLRIWRLFSLVFFLQLALGLAVDSLFFMTGRPHLPVPGLILFGPLYRGGGLFMPVLFGVSLLLVGAAWCSHLCYFGVWDTTAARRVRPAPPPAWLKRSAPLCFLLCLGLTLGLKYSGAAWQAAAAAGLLLGLLLIPAAALYSRKLGLPAYCLGCCPLGFVARLAGRIVPWRVRRTEHCTECGTCVRACRQGALSLPGLRKGGAGASCTLCRDCLSACPRQGLVLRFAGLNGNPATAERLFLIAVSVLHALFLGTARV